MTLGAIAIAVVASWFTPPLYRAQASLLVVLGREFIYRAEIDGVESATMFRLDEMINSEIEILESRALAATVVGEVGAATLYPKLADKPAAKALTSAVGQFREHLTVQGVPGSSVIEVVFDHADAELAARGLNQLVTLFGDKHLEIFGDPRSKFLERDVDEFATALSAAEQAQSEFAQEHGIFDFETQLPQLLRQRDLLQVGLRDLAATATRRSDDPAAARTRAELLRLHLRERELLGNYLPKSRQVVSVRREIEAAEEYLADLERVERQRREAETKAVEAQIAVVDTEIKRVTALVPQLRDLERRAAAAATRHENASQRLQGARTAEQLDEERRISVRVIDHAEAPSAPAGMSIPKRIALAGLLGLVLGVALAFTREARQRA